MRIYSNKFTVTLGEYKYHKIQTGVELKAYERLYDKANQYSFLAVQNSSIGDLVTD